MYCKENGFNFNDWDEVDCDDCEKDCSYLQSRNRTEKEQTEKFDRLRDSKLAQEIQKKLSDSLGLPAEEIGRMVVDVMDNATSVIKSTVNSLVSKAVEIATVKHIDKTLKSIVDEAFQKVVEEKIMVIQSDGEALSDTIRGQISKKMSSAFKDFKGRNYSDNLNSAISSCVQDKVSEAIKEIKIEAVDKFNKEAMKMMMSGMAKAIGEDKKLLHLLTN